jgi:tripartite-type tricarboxylate transporter receptor subunit TctC
MIVPYPPGGPTDVLARVLSEQMRGALGQPVIVENIAGAEGSIGVMRAARAKPDGYTIELGAMSTHVLGAAFYPLLYDVLNYFAPILPLVTAPQMLFVRNTIPANDLKELIAWLRAGPTAASVGIGAAISHLVAALFQRETGTQLTKVPYRTANVAMQDLVAGQIDLVFTTPDRLALVQAGGARAFAVTSDRRLAPCPDVPTFVENGLPALSFSPWFALFAPAGTPKNIIDRLNGAAAEALADPTARSRLVQFGMEIFPREQQTPEALSSLQKADAEKWWPLIKAAKIGRE